MALAALVAAMNGQHGAIVHTTTPHVGETVEQTGGAGAFGGIGNS